MVHHPLNLNAPSEKCFIERFNAVRVNRATGLPLYSHASRRVVFSVHYTRYDHRYVISHSALNPFSHCLRKSGVSPSFQALLKYLSSDNTAGESYSNWTTMNMSKPCDTP